MTFTSWCAQARRRIVPGAAAALFAVVPAFAEEPSVADMEQARDQLRLGLSARELPPASYDTTPVPIFAVPDGEPHVLPPPSSAARALMPDLPASSGNASGGTHASVPSPAAADAAPALPAEGPPPAPQPDTEPPTDVAKPNDEPNKAEPPQAPPEPAIAREEPEPRELKTGRAAAETPGTQADVPQPPKAKPAVPRPVLTLPEALRP